MKKLLITSIGSLVGQNVLDALEGRRDELTIIGTNSVAAAANNFRCDSVYLVAPALQRVRFIDDLINLIETEKPDVIIPGRDDDIEILAAIKESTFPDRQSFLCGSSDFARIMDDKVKSSIFAEDHQLPFAVSVETGKFDSLETANQLIEVYGFPLIAKPKRGNGSRGIWVITNSEQLGKCCGLEDYAIQPLIGHEKKIELDTTYGLPFVWGVTEDSLYAVQVLINKRGEVMGSFGFVAEMVMGKCEKITSVEDDDLMQTAHRFSQKAIAGGWVGPLNIQFKKDQLCRYQAIEMNGRFSGGTSARRYLGFDEVRILLNEWLGENLIMDSGHCGNSKTVSKSLVDFPIRTHHVTALENNGSWSS
jgi:carbamoyl-phosphate synthase large subunit